MAHGSSTTIDLTNLTSAGIAEAGISDPDLDALAAPAAAAFDRALALRAAGEVGFWDLPDDRALAREVMEYARGLPAEVDTFVVLGIGGSSLGPRALYSALAPPFDAMRSRSPGMPRRLLFPDNSDPVTFEALLALCPPERTVYNVITKSGGTAETAAQLLVVYDHLQRALGEERARHHLVATTDPDRGPLRRFATDLGLTTFAIPPSVGGRFSVLSAVGLLPAAAAGLDVLGLLDGARRMRERVAADAAREVRANPALALATMLYWHHTRRGRPMVVMMPYVDALADCAGWFRQLWAESLGKERDVSGNVAHVGPTPIASRGATDQHSQLQLYAEGPSDKVFLMVSARERQSRLAMPASRASAVPEYAYLAGRSMAELIDAELRGTTASLTRRGRPNATLLVDRVDAAAVGELLFLFEAACAFAGPLYGINPYDQPGVEEAKRLAYAALGRDGFDDLSAQLDAAPPDPRCVFR